MSFAITEKSSTPPTATTYAWGGVIALGVMLSLGCGGWAVAADILQQHTFLPLALTFAGGALAVLGANRLGHAHGYNHLTTRLTAALGMMLLFGFGAVCAHHFLPVTNLEDALSISSLALGILAASYFMCKVGYELYMKRKIIQLAENDEWNDLQNIIQGESRNDHINPNEYYANYIPKHKQEAWITHLTMFAVNKICGALSYED